MATLDSFWSIPPIQDAIASNLTSHHLTILCRVSQPFHAIFVLFLWRNIRTHHMGQLYLFIKPNAQSRYNHIVRTLHLDRVTNLGAVGFLASRSYPNLTSFAYSFPLQASESGARNLWNWIGTHTALESVSVRHQKVSTESLEIFSSVMAKLSRLRTLKLALYGAVQPEDLATVLGSCGGLEKLALECERELCQGVTNPVLDLDLDGTKVKDLVFRSRGSKADALLARFLEKSPLIEKLTLLLRHENNGTDSLLARALQTHCRCLQDLDLHSWCSAFVMEVLKGCPPLIRLELWLHEHSDALVPSILLNHGGTLERLNLRGWTDFSLGELYSIAGSCPSLRSLDIAIHCKDEFPWGPELVDSEPWVCTGLLSLQLEFKMGVKMDFWPWQDIYRQVGQLFKLKELQILANIPSQTFTDAFIGGMVQLSNLKALQVIGFSECRTCALTDDQLKAMVKQWPALFELQGLEARWPQVDKEEIVKKIRREIALEEGVLAL